MWALFRAKLDEVLRAVAPLVLLSVVLQIAFVDAPLADFLQFAAGAAVAVVGMVLLFAGVDFGILPMGRFIGAELPRKNSLALIVGTAAALGFAVTLAEPDVLVLADQAESASAGRLSREVIIYVTGLGVAIFIGLAMLRVVFGWSIKYLLAGSYGTMLLMTLFSSPAFVPLAYDAGSVTTGVLTAPVVISMAFGVSSVLAGRSPVADGLGLLGFASIGPVIAVMLLALVL